MFALLLALQAAPLAASEPPAITIVDCFPGPFSVFFPRNEARLDEISRTILDRVAEIAISPCGGGRIEVAGHIDRDERSGLDRQRARAVRAYLRQREVRHMRLSFWGASDPRVERARGAEEPQNQRVYVTFGPL